MTAVILTQAPVVAGPAVQFTFNATNADGTNTGLNWQTNDPLDIAACNGGTCPTPNILEISSVAAIGFSSCPPSATT